MKPYTQPYILHEKVGNNALSWEERRRFIDKPSLTIPSLHYGRIADVQIGKHIVFEEIKNGKILSCYGLEYFIRLVENGIFARSESHITLFDNHNHALYFWLEAMRMRKISPWATLVHVDEHSDLWENSHFLRREDAIQNEQYAWWFTNFCCDVGNYIIPALQSWIVWKVIRVENEYQIDSFLLPDRCEEIILNIDLDFFSPELDFIPRKKKILFLQNVLSRAQCVTIATSPFFIDQVLALRELHSLFSEEETVNL